METPMLSWPIICGLVLASGEELDRLRKLYHRLPKTVCLRRAHCCALLPEMTFVEALSAVRCLLDLECAARNDLLKRVLKYFFLNAVEITSCPFLNQGACSIYPDRFFGCRAYGLWSQRLYQTRASDDRQAKKALSDQWKKLGVSLPSSVIEFQTPYCPHVKPEGGAGVNDRTLLRVDRDIDRLSRLYSRWGRSFGRVYFHDLSFLMASLTFGASGAARMKFSLVREMLYTGGRQTLDDILTGLPDIGGRLG